MPHNRRGLVQLTDENLLLLISRIAIPRKCLETHKPKFDSAKRITMADASTFLSGITVLDLSQYVSGPFASQILGDMGAEVIKIEPPLGDEMYNLGPRDSHGNPVFYRSLNAGKSVLRLDLKTEEGKARLRELLAGADVLIEGFRPGTMARLGFDYESAKTVNPELIFCSISGYGPTGPLAPIAGHDANYLAVSGILHRNGTDKPVFFDPPVADISGALFAAIAILGALNGRGQTKEGTHIELGLADALMPLQQMQIAEWGANATVPGRRSTYLNGAAAYYQVYTTADERHVMLGAIEPKFWRNFCVAADRPNWIERQNETLPQEALIAELADFFAQHSAAQIAAKFAETECCLSSVLDLEQAITSPHLQARGLIKAGADGLQTLFPATFDSAPLPLRQPMVSHD